MIEVREDDNFLAVLDDMFLNDLLQDDELSRVEDCVGAGGVAVGVVQEIGMNGALSCQLGTSMNF